jgi:hypothetical protein
MPRKKDFSADRLRKHVKMETNPLAHAVGLVNDAVLLGAAYEAALRVKESDWNNEAQRATAAHQALSLDDLDQPLKTAFEAFGLDPRNPFHWRKLVAYLADVHFGPKQTRHGPKQLWSDDKLCKLLQDFDEVKSRRPLVPGTKISDLQVCDWLKRHSSLGKTYTGFIARTILRNLQRARNPKENCRLGEIVTEVADTFIDKLRAAAKARDVVLDQQWERQIRSLALEKVVKIMSSAWRKHPARQADKRTRRSLALMTEINDPDSIAAQRRAGLGY